MRHAAVTTIMVAKVFMVPITTLSSYVHKLLVYDKHLDELFFYRYVDKLSMTATITSFSVVFHRKYMW